MLYSKVDKILGTSVHDSTIRNTPNSGVSSSTEDKPPVLPMPATMSPITKSSFYRSTSSLSLRSSEYDKRSSDTHKQDLQSDLPYGSQARRNALDPTNVPTYSQRAVHHDVHTPYGAPSHDLPFRRSPMNREYPPSTAANRHSNVQGWQNEVNLAQRASRSTVNLSKSEPVYDTYAMQRNTSKTGIRPVEQVKELIPEGHFIDPFYPSKNPESPGYGNGTRKRCESVGQSQSPLSVSNLARADEGSGLKPFIPLRPLKTIEISNFNPGHNLDQPRTSNNAILTSKWSSASTDTNAYHTSALTAGLSSPISISSCVTSTPPSSATQSAFRGSTELGKVISPKSNTKTSPSVYSTHSFKSAQNDAFDDNSRRTNHADVKAFPLVRREALRNCLMDENVTKAEAAVRKGLMRKKDINERIIVLTTNARQIQGQLSAKLASLTGAQSIGQAKFSFNDLNGQETFVILHCFKSDHGLAKEEERLTLSSSSFVAVAESSSSFHIDREVWALKIAGHITSNNPPKTRAAEQQQSQWTLQFDTKHRMLKWQVILRALIAGLNEADQVFRIGPTLHKIKHVQSVNSISSASTMASSGGYQSVISHHERPESYEEMYGSANSPRSSPRSPYHFNKNEDLSRFVTSISSLSVNSDRTSQNDLAKVTTEGDSSFRQDRRSFHSSPSPPKKYSAEHLTDQKKPSVQARDFAVEEQIKTDVKPETQMEIKEVKALGLAVSLIPIAQSRKRSASVPQFAQPSLIDDQVIIPPPIATKQPKLVESAAENKNRKPLRPQQLPPPAAPLPVVPPRPASALLVVASSSPTLSNESHQPEQQAEEKVEDAAAAKIRRMRTEIALAMACAAAPRSMSMASSFSNFSEDIAEVSKRYSAESDVKSGNASYKELENEEETVDNRSDLKVNPVGHKNGTDEVDAIYAMIDLSYNIYGLSSASKNPNVFIPNVESMNTSNHTDGSNSVYFDEFASDPFQQMGTIKIDSASLQKARADLRNLPTSVSTDNVLPVNSRLEKRQSSLKKKSVPVSVECNEIIGIGKDLSSPHKAQGSKFDPSKGDPPTFGFAM